MLGLDPLPDINPGDIGGSQRILLKSLDEVTALEGSATRVSRIQSQINSIANGIVALGKTIRK